MLKYIDPTLAVTPQAVGPSTCKLFSGFKLMAVIDFPLVARVAGWWFKMLLFRSVPLCAVLALLQAAAEITFALCTATYGSICWTDVFVLEFVLSSVVGIAIGKLTCEYLEKRTQKWFVGPKRTITGLAKLVELFHPNVWWNYKWHTLESAGSFVGIAWMVAVTLITDLNIFFLRVVLGIPVDHWIPIARALLLAFLAMISVKEYYEFLNSTYCLFLCSNPI